MTFYRIAKLSYLPVAIAIALLGCTAGKVTTPREDDDSATDGDSDTDNDADSDTDSDVDSDTDVDSDSDTDVDTDVDCELEISESFTAAGLPTGWVIDSYDGDGYQWTWTTTGNTTGGSGGHYGIDGSHALNHDDRLITAQYDRGGCSAVDLGFNHHYSDNDADDFGYLDVAVDSGPWETVHTYSSTGSGPQTFDLTSYVGSGSQFQIRFRYVGYGDNFWRVDDVEVTGSP